MGCAAVSTRSHMSKYCSKQPYRSILPGAVGHPVQVKEQLEVQGHDLTLRRPDSQGCTKRTLR